MKESLYFSHDYNARVDEKTKALIRKHGMLGYGVFWAIVEDLYNNANALRTDYEGIAFDMRVEESVIISIVNDFDLFTINGDFFGSTSVEERMNKRIEKSKKASESAIYRWTKAKEDANALRLLCDSNAIKKEIKEIKEINKEEQSEKPTDTFLENKILIPGEKKETLSEPEQLPLKTVEEKKEKVPAAAKKTIKAELTPDIGELMTFCASKFDAKYINNKTIVMFSKLLKSYSKEQIKQAIENGTKDEFWKANFLSPAKLEAQNKEGVYYIDKFLTLKPNGTNRPDFTKKQPEHLHNGGKFTEPVTKANF